jgi:alpha-glucosidase
MTTIAASSLLPAHIPQWATGAVYQICTPSYKDSDGDGLGDLRGVISGLDYLKWLGVSAIWLTPIYPSPLLDLGYDVADYKNVNPRFGTLADFDDLLAEAHRRDLHIVLDFVPNHTSDQHPWFQESRASRDNARRDWYLWRDPGPAGRPPNNWNNQYEESDWTFDEATGQFYMHSFNGKQPDLNWQSPHVRAAIWDAMRFWLDRGVDGFRIDALVHLYKDPQLRDNPPEPGADIRDWPACGLLPAFTQDCGGLQEIVREMCHVVCEYPGRILIGENHLPPQRLALYYCSGVTHPVNSSLLDLKWDAANIRRLIDRYEGFLASDHWPNWVLGSHDNARIAGSLGPERARVAAMMQLTLRGTPILYYGEEIGMHNVDISPVRERDPLARRLPGKGKGRDRQRTPMQWTSEPHAGFTSGEPWLPVAADFATLNVQTQRDDPRSMLNLYRRLLALRATHEALHVGRYTPDHIDDRALMFVRETQRERMLIALNFTAKPLELARQVAGGRIVLSTQLDREDEPMRGPVTLRANEGLIVSLTLGL